MTAPKRRWFQFSLRTLLLIVAFVSIWAGGCLGLWRVAAATGVEGLFVVELFLDLSPAWVPIGFLGYVLGRRAVTGRTILLFAAAEVAAIALMKWIDVAP
jgi:hypothetical protein